MSSSECASRAETELRKTCDKYRMAIMSMIKERELSLSC